MTNAIDGLRAKFRFVLIQIEKTKQREMAARRNTNVAIERSKVAEKRSYYLRHRISALGDRLFINGIKLERTLKKLATARNRCEFNNDNDRRIYVDQKYNVETLEEQITNLEVIELEYSSDTAVLVAKKEMTLKRLEEVEENLSVSNETKKILENRLLRASESLRLKRMKRDLDSERRTSRSPILGQLKRYLQMANTRMDVEEQSIVEEYGSSLEDLTFNSKPLINVLTMLAEENSRYAGSVTKLVEERIYKVQM
ncbi:hypothetical protein QZH41_003285 [Actinostola sp. cb2023]|nr:hypothetical protein QZH41_003285 [Actinostola sp. cb2023]